MFKMTYGVSKKLFFLTSILMILVFCPMAQAASLSISDITKTIEDPQESIVLGVDLNLEKDEEILALNFDLSFDSSSLILKKVVIGPAAQNSGKTLSYSETSPGKAKVIIFGLNREVVSNGQIANIIFEAKEQGASVISKIVLDNALASDKQANSIPLKEAKVSVK